MANGQSFFTKVSALAGALTAAGVIVLLTILFFTTQESVVSIAAIRDKQDMIVRSLANDVASLKADIKEIEKILTANHLPENTDIALRFQQVGRRLDELSSQKRIIEVIETAVTDNPERAMSIPMLRKDVDRIRTDVVEGMGSVRAEIDRIYDLGKWFLGLIATMAIGVMGLAIGNLLKGSK